MASLQQPIRVRLQHDIMPSVDAVQYDTDREFHFVIDDYEIPEDTTDIRIYIEKPSGYALYNFGSLINGEVVYQPTPQTLAEVGTSTGQVQIIKNKAVLTSFPSNVARADATFLTCQSGDTTQIGLQMNVHEAYIKSSSKSLYVPYSEEDIIEWEFNISKDSDIPIVMSYEDGTPCRPILKNIRSTCRYKHQYKLS